jgi:hypothetical protein
MSDSIVIMEIPQQYSGILFVCNRLDVFVLARIARNVEESREDKRIERYGFDRFRGIQAQRGHHIVQ